MKTRAWMEDSCKKAIERSVKIWNECTSSKICQQLQLQLECTRTFQVTINFQQTLLLRENMHINRIKTDLICFNSTVVGIFPTTYGTLLFFKLLYSTREGKNIASQVTSLPLCVIDKTMCHVDFEWNTTANENLATVNEATTTKSKSLHFHNSKWKLALYVISISKKHETIWRSVKIFCVLVSSLQELQPRKSCMCTSKQRLVFNYNAYVRWIWAIHISRFNKFRCSSEHKSG